MLNMSSDPVCEIDRCPKASMLWRITGRPRWINSFALTRPTMTDTLYLGIGRHRLLWLWRGRLGHHAGLGQVADVRAVQRHHEALAHVAVQRPTVRELADLVDGEVGRMLSGHLQF